MDRNAMQAFAALRQDALARPTVDCFSRALKMGKALLDERASLRDVMELWIIPCGGTLRPSDFPDIGFCWHYAAEYLGRVYDPMLPEPVAAENYLRAAFAAPERIIVERKQMYWRRPTETTTFE